MYPTAADMVSSRRIALLPLDGEPVTMRMFLALRENADPVRLELLTATAARVRRKIAEENQRRPA
jgi:hypothetical protein